MNCAEAMMPCTSPGVAWLMRCFKSSMVSMEEAAGGIRGGSGGRLASAGGGDCSWGGSCGSTVVEVPLYSYSIDDWGTPNTIGRGAPVKTASARAAQRGVAFGGSACLETPQTHPSSRCEPRLPSAVACSGTGRMGTARTSCSRAPGPALSTSAIHDNCKRRWQGEKRKI